MIETPPSAFYLVGDLSTGIHAFDRDGKCSPTFKVIFLLPSPNSDPVIFTVLEDNSMLYVVFPVFLLVNFIKQNKCFFSLTFFLFSFIPL